ncbi:copper-fist-domain-containing protein [Meredithblackwellia eburnea MCA 4105]
MVLINGVKFSCTPCIKGHRSANCVHPDRPLTEIKKKGRPPAQCPKCRELRKSKTGTKCQCLRPGSSLTTFSILFSSFVF